ncbi:hypothetical protein [Caballeronia novacaledonica]|uniref:Uncharacterized protein n=1 Tax=Caballeronia novacaledonica TaxID=1544861 RepID=A0AA37I7L0_9BURK|nr:hypothetical protein [Caballeronia novacaledonica]GJH24293.1 hypothetical protein CBA19CS42_07275 [Caballeronia novacaledonica]
MKLQLSARLEAESHFVEDRAGRPGCIGHARDGGKAHPGLFANHLQHRRDSADTGYRANISRERLT